jgi:hypothetical protein
LAIACLTVNAVLWDLGYKVVLGVGNVLTDNWMPRAVAQRQEAIDLATTARQALALLDALRDLESGR